MPLHRVQRLRTEVCRGTVPASADIPPVRNPRRLASVAYEFLSPAQRTVLPRRAGICRSVFALTFFISPNWVW